MVCSWQLACLSPCSIWLTFRYLTLPYFIYHAMSSSHFVASVFLMSTQFVQYRKSAVLEDIDAYLSPVQVGTRVDGCVEVVVGSEATPSASCSTLQPQPLAAAAAQPFSDVALPPAPSPEGLDMCTSLAAQSSSSSSSSGVVSTAIATPELTVAAGEAAPAATGGGPASTWLRVLVPDPIGGEPLTRYLPTFMHGEALFEPVLEDGRFRAKAKKGESDYVVPEMQQ